MSHLFDKQYTCEQVDELLAWNATALNVETDKRKSAEASVATVEKALSEAQDALRLAMVQFAENMVEYETVDGVDTIRCLGCGTLVEADCTEAGCKMAEVYAASHRVLG